MIFVTVGTHEQPFDRLIRCVDDLRKKDVIQEEVVIQTGYCTYVPQYCEWNEWFTYDQMLENTRNAHFVITHGGPSSFMMSLQEGKIPIVVPRLRSLHEHVNDHQVEFVRAVAGQQGNIIVAENDEHLKEAIINYDCIVQAMPVEIKSNNKNFNDELERTVNELFALR